MLLPSIPISYLYAYNSKFYSYTLDATVVIAITYFGTTLAAIVLPWRKPEIYRASPISKYELAGIPLVTLAGVVFGGFLAFCIYKWFTDDVYGVNHSSSLRYMLAFEGDSQVVWFEGSYDEYEQNRRSRLGAEADQPHRLKYKPLLRR